MKKILLIEDNQGVRETTVDILRLADYEVEAAENGKLGVEKALQFRPDIIICDVMMPELDGYGVLHILNRKPETARIPFIFLTAKSDREDMRKGMTLGADDYLTKPFEETELLDAVESRLKRTDFLKQEFGKNLKGINSFFAEASKYAELKDLSKDRKISGYRKKHRIYREGGLAYQLYFIQKGKVKTYRTTESGKEFVTGIYELGDFIGYMPLLVENGIYTDTAVVLEDAEICAIPKEDFAKLIFGNKEVSNKFIGMLSSNLMEREEQLVTMAYGSVRQRTAKVLLKLLERKNEHGEANNELNITRRDLAGLVGTANETVIRTLSDFKEEGLIQIDPDHNIIANRKRLIQIADFNVAHEK